MRSLVQPFLQIMHLCSTNLKTKGFAGIVTAVAAWSIWGGDMFPAEDPKGGESSILCCLNSHMLWILTNYGQDPSMWADSELKAWLDRVWAFFRITSVLFLWLLCENWRLFVPKRGLLPDGKASREDLLERVRANMRLPSRVWGNFMRVRSVVWPFWWLEGGGKVVLVCVTRRYRACIN